MKKSTQTKYAKGGIEIDEANLNAEVTAILSQDKIFNDQGTINDLAQLDISVAEKILKWIQEKIFSFSEKSEARAMMLKAERLYRNAIKEAQKQNVTDKSSQYLIAKTTNGEDIVVADKFSFTSKDVKAKSITTQVKNEILNNIKKHFTINSDGMLVNFNKNSAKEFLYSKYNQKLSKNERKILRDKYIISGNLGEVIEIAKKGKLQPNMKGIHLNDSTIGKNGFYHYETLFAVPIYDSKGTVSHYNTYTAELVLDNNASGKVNFYDLINIKESRLTIDGFTSMGLANASSGKLSNKSISKSKKNASKNIQTNNKNVSSSNNSSSSLGTNTDELSGRKKDLMAVHNINEGNLVKSLELGGLAYPSIVVTKDDIGHNEFGDISLVFNKDTIDPQQNSDNKVYSRDAWTPTFPTVETKINQEEAFKVRNDLK